MAVIAGYNTVVSVTSGSPISLTDEATSTSDQLTYSITNTAKRFFDPDTAVVVQARYDEIQSVTITGTPTGGTFVLRFGGQNTSALNWNCTASQMQTALQALSSIGSGNALVTGGPGPGTAFTVEFTGTLGYASQALITLQTNSLTGGSSPSVAIAEVKDGSTWTTITSGFTQYNVYARVVFASAQAASTQVRFHSGAYFVFATLAYAANAEISDKMNMDDVTVFSTTGVENNIPTTQATTFKFDTVHYNSDRVKSLKARERLIIDVTMPTGDIYAGYCWTTDSNIKTEPKKANREALTFLLTDEIYAA
jgi:hypothetical protein